MILSGREEFLTEITIRVSRISNLKWKIYIHFTIVLDIKKMLGSLSWAGFWGNKFMSVANAFP